MDLSWVKERILSLEEYEHAKRRGARIYAEIVGYGATADAYTLHRRSGWTWRAMAMRNAMNEAGITPNDISMQCHGTSTPINDRLETMAMKAFLEKVIIYLSARRNP